MSRTIYAAATALLLGFSTAAAQDPSFHANERDRIDVNGVSWADIWGSGNRGYIGYFGDSNVRVANILDPDNISWVTTHGVSGPNASSSAQDVKTGTVPLDRSRNLLFVAIESGGDDGVEIVDITTPGSPQSLTLIDAEPGPYEFIHNVSYREDGWLVLCDSGNPSLAIIDLRNYDPNSPPAAISNWAYELTGLGFFVHDITINDQYLFISGWDCMIAYDVSDLGNSAPTFVGEVRGLSSHAVWSSDDGQWVVTTEERQGGASRLYEVVPNGGSIELIERDSYVSPLSGVGETYSAHNTVYFDGRFYVSNYSAGVMALQIDPTSKTWERVASYDTSTAPGSGFAGSWGVYPLLGHDRVLASDLEEGFHTLDFSGLEITPTAARPRTLTPNVTTAISIDVRALGNATLASGGVDLFTSIDGGGFASTSMTNAGGGTFTADLPAVGCGQRIDYYFSAATTGAEVFASPADAPTSSFTTFAAGDLTEVFSDNFEADRGWQVTNQGVSTGGFVRGIPQEDGAQPFGGDPDDAGERCFITGIGSNGGSAGADDLDDGTTRLQSPDMDFSAGDGLISYKRWYFNSTADVSDALVVEVSNNSGSSWTTVETVVFKAGGWLEHTFRVSDFVAPTGQTRVRFSVSDDPNDSLTEVAIDTVRGEVFDCTAQPAAVAFFNGGGTNTTCYSANAPVLGSTWTATVDHSSHPGATLTQIRMHAAGASGLFFRGQELLINVGSTRFFVSNVASAGTQDLHSQPIPNDPALAGIFAATQGLILGGAQGIELCNAQYMTVGF